MTDAGDDDRVERPVRRRRSASGALILAAALRGLEEALHGPREREAQVEFDAGGEPPHPDFELELPEDPAQARLILRSRPDGPNGDAPDR